MLTSLKAGALALALSIPAPVSSGVPLAFPSPFTASFASVPRLECGNARGSGVRIGDKLIITAAHVNINRVCSAFGVAIRNTYREPKLDVAFAEADMGEGLRSIVSCEGIHSGERYLAMGYADGGAPNVEPLIGTDVNHDGQQAMRGKVYHGMSGGAVLNSDGALVAVINAMNTDKPVAWVTPLSETYLCA